MKSNNYIQKLNDQLTKITEWILNNRLITIAASIILCISAIFFSMNLHIDTSLEANFMEDDPSFKIYRSFMDEYGNDEFIYILYSAEKGVFNLDILKLTKKLVADLETIPHVKQVNSVTNIEFMEGDINGNLIINDLMKEFPASQRDADILRDKLLEKPLYVNSYITKDKKYAAIMCEMEAKPEDDPNYHTRIGDALKQVLSKEDYKEFKFWPVGDPVINSEYYVLILDDMFWLSSITGLLVFGFLFLLFRQLKGLLGLMFVMNLAILLVMGFLGIMNFSITALFNMVPSLICVIGVADGVHLLNEYKIHLNAGYDNRASIIKTVKLLVVPCLFTSITTAVGLGSMSISPIRAISEYGWYTVVGVLAIFVLTFSLYLVVLSFSRGKEKENNEIRFGESINSMLNKLTSINMNYNKIILAVTIIICAVSIYGISKVEVNSSYLEELGDNTKVFRDYQFVDKTIGGSGSFEVILDSGKPEGVKTLKFIQILEKIQNFADSQGYIVSKTISIVDIIKDANCSLHGNDKSYYRLPDSDNEISQYTLLYEISGGRELEKLVSGNIASARLTIAVKSLDARTSMRFRDDLSVFIEANLSDNYKYDITGASFLLVKSLQYMEESTNNSILLALAIISLMMIFVFRSLKVGLISMVPNIIPVMITLGFMGLAGIWLDAVRSLIACIAIGLAVDDTIHFIFRYRYEFQRRGNYEKALNATLINAGRAILITTVILVIGFSVLMLSNMNDLHYFGMLSAMCMLIALLADFFVAPALILFFKPFGEEFIPEVNDTDS